METNINENIQNIDKTNELTYKIALPTNRGKTISSHFGRAKYFLIVEIKGKKIIDKILRNNDSHVGIPHHHHGDDHNHKHEAEHSKHQGKAHARILEILNDVDIIFARNIGPRIYNQLIENGYTVIKVETSDIEQAITLFLEKGLKEL